MKKLTVQQLAKAIWQREIDNHEHDEPFEDLQSSYEAQATDLLKLFHETIDRDAAYALGEEAFRTGFNAGWDASHNQRNDFSMNPRTPKELEEEAWSDYEPNEAVKELIHGTWADTREYPDPREDY